MNIALSGLRTAQLQLDVASNNIANANVEGYTRKYLPTRSVVLGSSQTVFGVSTETLKRDMDTALRRDYWQQINRENYLAIQSNYLNKVQLFHGASDSEDSISNLITNLESSFVRLASSPDDNFLQQQVVNQASLTAQRFNDFSDFINNTRNDIQAEIETAVTQVNSLLESIATLNSAIRTADISGASTANIEDRRDNAIAELNSLVKVSTFTRSDGVVVVQVGQGTVIVEETAETLFFSNTTIGSTNTANSVFVGDANGFDLSSVNIGGELGALLELRDETLTGYQAQIDELAHKLTLRFAEQGLEMFQDSDGSIPGNNVNDYLGYAGRMKVNPDVIDDISLVRDGTEAGLSSGIASSEFIQKILDYTFGSSQAVNVTGTADLTAAPDLFTALGISAVSRVSGTEDIISIGVLDSHDDIGTGQTFSIQSGVAPGQTFTIGAGDTAQDLVNAINTAFGGTVTASLSSGGQIGIEGSEDLTISLGTLSADGLSALGLDVGVTAAVDPSFTIELSTGNPVEVSISSTDDANDLINNLNAINGVSASLGPGNVLYIEPTNGGDLKLLNSNGDLLSALGVTYGVIEHEPMATTNLGASGEVDSRIASADFIGDYASRMINIHSSDYNDAVSSQELEADYRVLLDKTIKDRFGVDIDQEVAEIIEIQANYSAAARVVTAAQELFDELLATFN